MEVRLLLAFLLMGAVMFLTPYLYKTPPPPQTAKKTTAAQTEPAPAPAVAGGCRKRRRRPVAAAEPRPARRPSRPAGDGLALADRSIPISSA